MFDVLIVYVNDDRGAANIMIWDQVEGTLPITDDSADELMFYANPDIDPAGAFVVFEKVEMLTLINLMAYDMTELEPAPFQVTFDGFSTMPVVSPN